MALTTVKTGMSNVKSVNKTLQEELKVSKVTVRTRREKISKADVAVKPVTAEMELLSPKHVLVEVGLKTDFNVTCDLL